jgi:hypothetical protein
MSGSPTRASARATSRSAAGCRERHESYRNIGFGKMHSNAAVTEALGISVNFLVEFIKYRF